MTNYIGSEFDFPVHYSISDALMVNKLFNSKYKSRNGVLVGWAVPVQDIPDTPKPENMIIHFSKSKAFLRQFVEAVQADPSKSILVQDTTTGKYGTLRFLSTDGPVEIITVGNDLSTMFEGDLTPILDFYDLFPAVSYSPQIYAEEILPPIVRVVYPKEASCGPLVQLNPNSQSWEYKPNHWAIAGLNRDPAFDKIALSSITPFIMPEKAKYQFVCWYPPMLDGRTVESHELQYEEDKTTYWIDWKCKGDNNHLLFHIRFGWQDKDERPIIQPNFLEKPKSVTTSTPIVTTSSTTDSILMATSSSPTPDSSLEKKVTETSLIPKEDAIIQSTEQNTLISSDSSLTMPLIPDAFASADLTPNLNALS